MPNEPCPEGLPSTAKLRLRMKRHDRNPAFRLEKPRSKERQNRYMVRVAPAANKIEIRKAVEDLFNVTVLAVNTQNYEGRTKVLRNRRTAKAQDWSAARIRFSSARNCAPDWLARL